LGVSRPRRRADDFHRTAAAHDLACHRTFLRRHGAAKSVLNVMACVVVICASVSLLWYLVGYSLAFTPGSSALAPFIGGTDKLWFAGLDCLKDTQQVAVSHITPNIPGAVYSMLQLTFAIITAALVDWCAPVCWARAAVEAVSLFLRQSGFDDGRCRHAVGGLVWLQRRFCRGLGRPCGSGHGCHAHCSGCRRAAMNGSPLSRLNACRWNLPPPQGGNTCSPAKLSLRCS